MNASELIGKYIELRNRAERVAKEREEADKPYVEGMQALEGMVTKIMLDQGVDSLKTENGTAYRTTLMSVKMADREAFMRFVFENEAEAFLTSAVAKEAVKEYIQENNSAIPPGLDISYIHKTNFRKAS